MQVAATFQNPMTKTAVEVLIFATFLTLLTCVNSATFQGWISLLNHPDPLSLSHCTLFFWAHVVCVNRRWVLADTWSKVCCPQTCLTSHSKDEPVGRLEWISNSSWKFIAQPDGLHNWPHVVVSAVFSKRECSYTWGKFLQAVTEKERDKLKKGGKKPLSHLASCLKKKRKWVETFSTLPQSDSWNLCNIQQKSILCLKPRIRIHSSSSGQS